LPRLALPEIDEPGEIARYLFAEGLPGEFPFLNGAYREMYLEPIREIESFEKNGEPSATVAARKKHAAGTRRADAFVLRLDARRGHQRAFSLSHPASAHAPAEHRFRWPTLYGIDSDADGVFGKIGEGGVAIDTVEGHGSALRWI
jgi:methylmalonyl-CoA mutase